MPMREKEKIQFVTFESFKGGFHKVFKNPNDAMAEIFFRFVSDCTLDNILTSRVTYH